MIKFMLAFIAAAFVAAPAAAKCFEEPSEFPGCTVVIPRDYSAFRDGLSHGQFLHVLQTMNAKGDTQGRELLNSQFGCGRGWDIAIACLAQRYGSDVLPSAEAKRLSNEAVAQDKANFERMYGKEKGAAMYKKLNDDIARTIKGLAGEPRRLEAQDQAPSVPSARTRPPIEQTDKSLQNLLDSLDNLKGIVSFDIEAARRTLNAARGEAQSEPPAQARSDEPKADKAAQPKFRYLMQDELTALLAKVSPEERRELVGLFGAAQEKRKWELALKYGVADTGRKVEELPITPTDQIALKAFYNMGAYMSAQDAVLADAAKFMVDSQDRYKPVLLSGQSPWDAKSRYVTSLGAGHGSKIMFDLLASYYASHGPQGKVLFRTTDAKAKWVASTFKGDYSHVIESSDVNLALEYYAIPGSHLYAYRMLGQAREDVSGYAVVTNSPAVFRQSFSIQSPKETTVDNSWGVDKRYAADLLEVLEDVSSAAVTIKRDWTAYSHLFTVKAPKLYQSTRK
ncbi:MAG: hypothetical protein HY077_02405 [Elusimicrobia bacterium]|nr:hypothetical protein [Elusimicrobiota bacterium]